METTLETGHGTHHGDEGTVLNALARILSNDHVAVLTKFQESRARRRGAAAQDELEAPAIVRDGALGIGKGPRLGHDDRRRDRIIL